jgi:hypothetical protein
MKSSLVKPVAPYILIKRQTKELSTGGALNMVLADEQGIGDFLVHGTAVAVHEGSSYAVGDELIYHELSVEGGFRDEDDRKNDFILVPLTKILGKYGE